jgi:isopentenyl diphosphate isomerase/L-lactate dehydrogenase-like FMN-dependent dehydrogenase
MLVVLGIIVGLIAVAWLFSNEDLDTPAQVLGLGIALVVLVAPMVGGGIYLTAFGQQEAGKQAEAETQRRLLNIVKTQGEVRIEDVALEMQLSRDEIKEMLYHLVGLGVYSGYVKWDEGKLVSSEASQLRELKQCPNCGGDIELTGKGIAECRYCGTEFYLS